MFAHKFIVTLLIVAYLGLSQTETDRQGPKSVSVPVPVVTDGDINDAKMLEYKNSFNEILKDLINNWQSPIRYLKSRGYLPKELEHEMQLTNLTDPLVAAQVIGSRALQTADNKREDQFVQKTTGPKLQRGIRATYDNGLIGNLKGMIGNLFTNKDADFVKKFRSIPLDIDELRLNAKKEAQKYYEDVLKKLVDRGEFSDDVKVKPKVQKSNFTVEKPNYLKWDLKGNQLRFVNSSKDEYLSGLVKAFANKGNFKRKLTVHKNETAESIKN